MNRPESVQLIFHRFQVKLRSFSCFRHHTFVFETVFYLFSGFSVCVYVDMVSHRERKSLRILLVRCVFMQAVEYSKVETGLWYRRSISHFVHETRRRLCCRGRESWKKAGNSIFVWRSLFTQWTFIWKRSLTWLR